jgi:hypothetical protein
VTAIAVAVVAMPVRSRDDEGREPQGGGPAGQRTFQYPMPGRIILPMTAARPWLLVVLGHWCEYR